MDELWALMNDGNQPTPDELQAKQDAIDLAKLKAMNILGRGNFSAHGETLDPQIEVFNNQISELINSIAEEDGKITRVFKSGKWRGVSSEISSLPKLNGENSIDQVVTILEQKKLKVANHDLETDIHNADLPSLREEVLRKAKNKIINLFDQALELAAEYKNN